MAPTKTASKRITIKNVAEDAGVSVSAVSKVMRNAYGVSDALRAKVEESMSRLGYRPLVAARGMRGKSYTFGVLMTDTSNGFFADVLQGINEMAHSSGYQALMGLSEYDTFIEANLLEAMIDRQMDGVIIIGPQLLPRSADTTEEKTFALARAAQRIPLAVIGHHSDADEYDTVNGDDVRGAEIVVEHLIQQGCRNIAFITPGTDSPLPVTVAQKRELGYRRAMQKAGLGDKISVYSSPLLKREDMPTVKESLQTLFSRRERPDAVFCWSDLVAFDVLSGLIALGYDVPGDVCVVGYDNTRACDLFQNSLSSVNHKGFEQGKLAATHLLERIEGRTTCKHVFITPELAVRRTSLRRS